MRHRAERESSEINVTPLLDIVFILLIFFIVTTTFARESAVDMERASLAGSSSNTSGLTILVAADGALESGGRPVSAEAVAALVAPFLSDDPIAAVIVIAHRSAPVDAVVGVIDSARRAGAANVSLMSSRRP